MIYFYDASNADKIVFEINPDVYYAMAGDDADFLVGGDIARLDFRMALKELKMPTLILSGRFERIVLPRFTIQYQQYMPQAKFVMFEKSGHIPFVEETNKTFEILREFLTK